MYSLAVVAWEALSGKRAYEGRTPFEIARRKALEPPPPLSDAWADAPPAAVAALQRAMAADPASRPKSATAFVDELAHALRASTPVREDATTARREVRRPLPETPPVARPVPKQSGRRRARFLPLAALLVALAVAAAAVLAFSGGDSSSPPAKHQAAKDQGKKTKKKKPTKATSAATPVPTPTQPSPTPSSGTSATSGSALNDQGYSLIQQGRYAEAVPILEKAVHAFPAGTSDVNYQYALFNLGHALRLAGRPAEAIPVLEQRLAYPNQRATVQAELDAARRAAGKH
jgi:serine/threonine-protein kinase